MAPVHSFPPISSPSARILVLGTMPGNVSLRENRYYAHPRNSFWTIVGAVLGFESSLPYQERAEILRERGFALWDVLQLCTRQSSLDSDIDDSSVVPNDFGGYLDSHPRIRRICFNGAKAAELFRKHVTPSLGVGLSGIETVRLPSTSPANAAVRPEDKLSMWRAALAGS